jgi:ABC-type lipoprotein release transport system permease subunit
LPSRVERFAHGYQHAVWNLAVDPVTFIGVPLLLAVMALVASYVPACRATRIDPALALRGE